MAAERVSVTLGQAVIPPSSLSPSQFTKARPELQNRADQRHLQQRTGQGQEEAMPTGTGVSDPGAAEDLVSWATRPFPKDGKSDFIQPSGTGFSALHPPRLEFSRNCQASSLGGFG